MQNRDDGPFDFKKWVKKTKSKKFIDECKDRIDNLDQSSECKYYFDNNEFKIIKVTY